MQSKFNLVAFILAVGFGVASCGSSSTSPPVTDAAITSAATGYQMLAPTAADALLRDPPKKLVVLDVRTPAEFAAGHIAGAIDIDLTAATFAGETAKLDPKTPYFVYCHSGNRSAQAVAFLQQHGFNSIYELQGGIAAWQAAGLPVTTGTS
ncbi:MAG: rhodanese-like domain-containing protein [Ilumatobacteraceae bacterium]